MIIFILATLNSIDRLPFGDTGDFKFFLMKLLKLIYDGLRMTNGLIFSFLGDSMILISISLHLLSEKTSSLLFEESSKVDYDWSTGNEMISYLIVALSIDNAPLG